MTIRQHLDRKLVRAYGLLLLSVALIPLWLALMLVHPIFLLLGAIVSFVIGLTGRLEIGNGIRCPRCRTNLFWVQSLTPDWRWRFSKKIKTCPCCELDFDARFEDVALPTP